MYAREDTWGILKEAQLHLKSLMQKKIFPAMKHVVSDEEYF